MGGGEANSPQEPASCLAVSPSPRVPSSGVSMRDTQDWVCKGVLGQSSPGSPRFTEKPGGPHVQKQPQEARVGRSRGGAEV